MALTSSQNPKRITEITSTITASEPIRSCGAVERLALYEVTSVGLGQNPQKTSQADVLFEYWLQKKIAFLHYSTLFLNRTAGEGCGCVPRLRVRRRVGLETVTSLLPGRRRQSSRSPARPPLPLL